EHFWEQYKNAGKFLLLLLLMVSNLLLCQGVVSAPLCQNPSGKCQMPLQSLFDTILVVSSFIECQNNLKELNVLDHSQDKQFGQGKNFISRVLNSCHTESIITPDNKDEAEHTQDYLSDEILIRLVLSLLLSWDEPLHHPVTELQGMKHASPDLLSKATEIEEKTKVLLEGAEQIQKKKVNLLSSVVRNLLTAGDEDVHQNAFYKMFHCLHRDARKIDIYL
uniref:Prolactin n=1 Tax=Bos indicus x Bos taurus TaxID=30522 RepID=A0A4W2C585_BOBOX